MKKSMSVFVSLLAMAVLAATTSMAAEQAGKPGKRGPGDPVKMMTEQLGLTDAQQEQVRAIGKAQMEQRQALRDDTSISQDEKRAKMQEFQKARQAQIRAILTPEQQAKFDTWHSQRGERGPRGAKGEKQVQAPKN